MFCLAHNGQFTKNKSSDYTNKSDTAIFVEDLANSTQKNWPDRISQTLKKYRGAYSLLIATKDSIFCARDPLGIRPLVYGKLSKSPPYTWVIASETASIEKMGGVNIKEALPGSIIEFAAKTTIFHQQPTARKQRAQCIFENVYFMDGKTHAHFPTENTRSIRNHPTVNLVRYRSGQILAEESPPIKNNIDFVCGIPETGISGGQGYANQLCLPYVQAILDHNMPNKEQRTFMQSNVDQISQKILNHFDIAFDMFNHRNVLLVDDSIVRGNVITGLIKILRQHARAKSIHVRIVCPPIDKTCYLGINTRNQQELLAYKCGGNIKKMKKQINADSLAFLSASGLKKAITNKDDASGFCLGCMVGYQPPMDKYGKRQPTIT